MSPISQDAAPAVEPLAPTTVGAAGRVPAPSPDPDFHNTLGRMTCLTLLTPIRPQYVRLIKAVGWLARRSKFIRRRAGILQFNFIQFVRWAVVDEFPHHGSPQLPERLNYSYLLFESNFDGPWQHYIDAFAYVIAHNIRRLWGRGINFPAPPPSEPLKAWIAMNSRGGGTYYMAYPHASTRMVEAAITVRERLRQLVAESKSLDHDAFQERYQQFLTDIQGHL